MPRAALIALIAIPLPGCHRPTQPLSNANPVITVQSTTFAGGQPIPAECGADGGNVSPELHWSSPPPGSKSLLLIVEDPDAPSSSAFVHWVAFNIPITTNGIPEGGSAVGAVLGKNDAGTVGYYGPKPPSGTHHYHFRLYALDKTLDLKPGASAADVIRETGGHELGMGELVGLFSH